MKPLGDEYWRQARWHAKHKTSTPLVLAFPAGASLIGLVLAQELEIGTALALFNMGLLILYVIPELNSLRVGRVRHRWDDVHSDPNEDDGSPL